MDVVLEAREDTIIESVEFGGMSCAEVVVSKSSMRLWPLLLWADMLDKS